MNEYLKEKILEKLFENLNFCDNGMIIASPSNDPPYKYHWVRDASIVMRVIINLYSNTNEDKYFSYLIRYIENCNKIQKLDTLTGLGEPKINLDITPYNEPWGRPQNDGPALRGINLIKIYKLFHKKYSYIAKKLIEPLIINDLEYILDNFNKTCFDLWEEITGWHFYTRLVQLKFLKDYISLCNEFAEFKILNSKECFEKLFANIKHHIYDEGIISSFNSNGDVIRNNDSSILLAICHIDYDEDIIKLFNIDNILFNCNDLLHSFRKKYNLDNLNLIGRYENDKYYNGHTWIICSLALAQIYLRFSKKEKYKNLRKMAEKIINYIISIDINLDLSEQYDPINNKQYSAEKLTWNYSEFYMTYIEFFK